MSEKLRNTEEGTRTLFEAIFANPEHTEFALDLYNAIEGTHYKDTKSVRVLELPRGVYICVDGKGLLVWNQMNVFAEPFEWTPDKTVEGFIYLISALDRIEPELKSVMNEEEFSEFSMPHFVALYTGEANAPAKELKNIAEAFENQNSGDITFKMEIYNILSKKR